MRNIFVLIVDDSEQLCRMLKDQLEDKVANIEYVLNGLDALEAIRYKQYDVVFIDVVMPGINGIQTAVKIREFNTEIKIIIMSGYSVHNVYEEAKASNIYEFLKKPVNITQITDIMNVISFEKV